MADDRREKTTTGSQEEGIDRERKLDSEDSRRRHTVEGHKVMEVERQFRNNSTPIRTPPAINWGYYGSAGRPRSIRIEIPRKDNADAHNENGQNEQEEHIPYTRDEVLSSSTDIGIKKEMLQGLEIIRDSVIFVVFAIRGQKSVFIQNI